MWAEIHRVGRPRLLPMPDPSRMGTKSNRKSLNKALFCPSAVSYGWERFRKQRYTDKKQRSTGKAANVGAADEPSRTERQPGARRLRWGRGGFAPRPAARRADVAADRLRIRRRKMRRRCATVPLLPLPELAAVFPVLRVFSLFAEPPPPGWVQRLQGVGKARPRAAARPRRDAASGWLPFPGWLPI